MFERWLLFIVVGTTVVAPAQAGIFFGRKKDKMDPKTRVPELITVLRTDRDPDRRLRAAEELRNYDAQAFPDVTPALIGALLGDAKPGVRVEAAQSLGRIRPVSAAAGEALEKALTTDTSMRVRLQARSALMQYHWAGYRSGKKPDVPPLGSPEPPVGGKNLPPVIRTTPSDNPRTTSPPPRFPSSNEPPLAPPEPAPKPVPRPMPVSPSAPPPVSPPVEVKPLPLPSGPGSTRPGGPDQGPDLP